MRTPDWLDHMLTVTGLADTLAAFRVAASGPGGLPFHCNGQLEEDWMHLLLPPPLEERGISVEGARILAARLRERVESRAQAELEMRQAASCSLDLQALLPVPPSLLRRGPNDPRVLDWLWVHWGTTWPLRRASAEPLSPADRKMLPAGHDGICYRFWSADWTPWRALDAIRKGWPDLALMVVVHYGEASLAA